MRVVIIDPYHPDEVVSGESDLKRVDGIYVSVLRDGVTDKSAAMRLTPIAYVYYASEAEYVQKALRTLAQEKKDMENRHWKELMAIREQFGIKAPSQ